MSRWGQARQPGAFCRESPGRNVAEGIFTLPLLSNKMYVKLVRLSVFFWHLYSAFLRSDVSSPSFTRPGTRMHDHETPKLMQN